MGTEDIREKIETDFETKQRMKEYIGTKVSNFLETCNPLFKKMKQNNQ
jgi:hypothetical protein